MLRLKTSPFLLQGKLYDYYLPSDIHNCQEEQDVDSIEDGGALVREEREKDVYSEDEETDEGKGIMDDSEETEDSKKPDKPDGAEWFRFKRTDLEGWTTGQGNRGYTGAVEGRDEGSEAGYEDSTSEET